MDIFETLTSDAGEKFYMEGRLLFDFGIILSEEGARGFHYGDLRSDYKRLLDYDYGNEDHLLVLRTLGNTVVDRFGGFTIRSGYEVFKAILDGILADKHNPTFSPGYMRAVKLATIAHAGQQRRYHSGVPYMVHPLRVSQAVSSAWLKVWHSLTVSFDELVTAAVLHDAVEDTELDIATVATHFGWKVAELIAELTNPSATMPKTVSRAERKRADFEHVAAASMPAKMIKLEDRIDNLLDAPMYDGNARDFLKKKYIGESESLHDVLKDVDSAGRLAFTIELTKKRLETFEKLIRKTR